MEEQTMIVTDEQTLQTMKCCVSSSNCNNCLARGVNMCTRYVMQNAIDVIEGLKEDIVQTKKDIVYEFADRLKAILEWCTEPINNYDIEQIVKEMAGED